MFLYFGRILDKSKRSSPPVCAFIKTARRSAAAWVLPMTASVRNSRWIICRFVAQHHTKRHKRKMDYRLHDNPLIFVVPLTGIELVTFALRMRCSTD
jgi:hypothetical protein